MRYFLLILASSVLFGCRGCDDLGDPTNESCGNDTRELREVCDGTDLAGQTCASRGFEGGELGCSPSCGGFVVAGCVGDDETTGCGMCGPDEMCLGERCVPACVGEAFESDATVDFDVRTRQFRTTVTFGGEPSSSVEERGELVLVSEAWWDGRVVEVPPDGVIDVVVPAGPLTVRWRTENWAGAATIQQSYSELSAPVDFDVPAWEEVTGRVAFGDNTPAETAYDGERGTLVFERVSDDPAVNRGTVGLPIDGDGAFAAPLRRGDYRIWWAVDGENRRAALLREWTFEGGDSAELDVEIPLRRVDFQVTVAGRAFTIPDGDGVDARLQLHRDAAEPRQSLPGYAPWDLVFAELDERGMGSIWLLADDYHVALTGSDPIDGALWLRHDMPLGEAETETFDVPVGRVEGIVTRNGGRVPNASLDGASRGRVRFFREDGSWIQTTLDSTGKARFAAALPTGRWRAVVTGNYWTYALPLIPYEIPGKFSVASGELVELDYDVPAFRLTGEVSVNGARPADESELTTRGTLEFSGEAGVVWHTVPLPARGPAVYDVILAPGEYQWSVVRWWYAAGDEERPAGVLPIGEWEAGSFELQSATRRDVDLRVYDVEIELVVEGDEPPATDGPRRGVLWFGDGNEFARVSREVEIPADGRAVVSTTLYPGRYSVAFVADEGVDGLPAEPVLVDSGLAVADDVVKSYDLDRVEITGSVTLDGEPLADGPEGRGTLEFLRVPDVAQATHTTEVSGGNEATFSAEILPGQHEVYFTPAADHPDLPGQTAIVHYACGERPYR